MYKASTKIFLYITVLICLFSIICPAYASENKLKKVSFISQWVPQAQFAGYYLAHEKGIYKKYGLDVKIINGGPHISPCDLLRDKEADFINIGLNTAIEARVKGLKLVNIGQIMQKSGLMLVAKRSSGIESIEDINNKKVGVWTGISQTQALSFIKKYGLKVDIVPQTYSVNLFLRDGVDVASAMWYNEYHTILNSGYDADELTTFFFSEHDLNFPEDGIYTLEETLKKSPDICHAFVRASIEGWIYTFSHTGQALDIVLRYAKEANIPANRMHQKWMLERMRDLILVDNSTEISGVLTSDDYYRVAEELKDAGMIDTIPLFDTFYKKSNTDYDKK